MSGIYQILLVVLGAIPSWYFSRRYFKKSAKTTSLKATFNNTRNIIPNEQKIANDLEVKFNGRELSNLFVCQFLIANDGTEPITGMINPLALHVPTKYQILKAEVAAIDPEGRSIEIDENPDNNLISFQIPLLNQKEAFVVDLLLTEIQNPNSDLIEVKNDVFYLTISAAGLPPRIEIQNNSLMSFLTVDLYETLKPITKIINVYLKWIVILFQFVSILLLWQLIWIFLKLPEYNPFNFKEFWQNFDWGSVLMIISIIITVFALIITSISLIGFFKSKKTILPFETEFHKKFAGKMIKW